MKHSRSHRSWIVLSVVLFGAFPCRGAEPVPLKNPDFTAARSDAKPGPPGWYLEGNCKVSTSKADGVAIQVTAAGKKDGPLTQSIDVAPQASYTVTAEIKSSVPQMAYLQIEFLNGGLEIKSLPRIDSEKCGADWTTLTVKFNTKEAKRFSVLCRFEQTDRTVGQTASFRNVRVVKE